MHEVKEPAQRQLGTDLAEDVGLEMRNGLVAELPDVFAGSVLHVEDNVRDCVVGELTELGVLCQLKLPNADRAGAFKGKITFAAEIEFEHPAVVLTRTGSNGVDANVAFAETIIVGVGAAVIMIVDIWILRVLTGKQAVNPEHVLQHSERGVHRGAWARN